MPEPLRVSRCHRWTEEPRPRCTKTKLFASTKVGGPVRRRLAIVTMGIGMQRSPAFRRHYSTQLATCCLHPKRSIGLRRTSELGNKSVSVSLASPLSPATSECSIKTHRNRATSTFTPLKQTRGTGYWSCTLCASAIRPWCEGRRSLLTHSTVKPAGSLSVTPTVNERQNTAKFITLCRWLKLNDQRERRYMISRSYVPTATASSTCEIHRIRLRNSDKCSRMHEETPNPSIERQLTASRGLPLMSNVGRPSLCTVTNPGRS